MTLTLGKITLIIIIVFLGFLTYETVILTLGVTENFIEVENNYFEYSYQGVQVGKSGEYIGYEWSFEEKGKYMVTLVQGNIIHGNITFTGKITDTEGFYSEYSGYGNFTYYVNNRCLYEIYQINYGSKIEETRRMMIGAWFYLDTSGNQVTIENQTCYLSKETIYQNYIFPINVFKAYRRSPTTFVENGRIFKGEEEATYFYDVKTGLLLRYSLEMYMDEWDYFETFKVTNSNMALTIALDKIILIASISSFLISTPYLITIAIAKLLYSRSIKKMEKIFVTASKDQIPEPIEISRTEPSKEVLNLREGAILWYTGSDHLILDYKEKKRYAITPIQASKLRNHLCCHPKINVEEDSKVLSEYILGRLIEKGTCLPPDNLIKELILKNDLKTIKHVPSDLIREFEDLRNFMYEIVGYKKVYASVYGQAFISPSLNAFRALTISRYVSRDSRVALLGDDDLLSLLLAKMGFEIYVFEIDEYTTYLINALARKYGFDNITIYKHDLRFPIPSEIRYEAFHTDPGYHIDGLMLFLSRGLSNLRPEGFGFISWKKNILTDLVVEKAFKQSNLNIIKVFGGALKYVVPIAGIHTAYFGKYGGFTRYVPIFGFYLGKWKANLWIIKKTYETKPLIKENILYSGQLY